MHSFTCVIIRHFFTKFDHSAVGDHRKACLYVWISTFRKKCEPKIIQSTSHAIWKQSVNKSSIIDCILNEYDALLMPSLKMGCLKCPIGLWVVSHFINSSHWINRYREQKMKHFFLFSIKSMVYVFLTIFLSRWNCWTFRESIDVLSEKCKCLWHICFHFTDQLN